MPALLRLSCAGHVRPRRAPRHPADAGRRLQSGAGLIEVLVAVLLVAVGLLGSVSMHVRSIDYTMDTERRQMASALASELMETMRSDTARILDAKGMPLDGLGGYQKAASTALQDVESTDCQPLAAEPAKRLGCWGQRAMRLMPELTAEQITSAFAVGADTASGLVSVTVAWPVKKGQCLNGADDEYCTFTLRSRL